MARLALLIGCLVLAFPPASGAAPVQKTKKGMVQDVTRGAYKENNNDLKGQGRKIKRLNDKKKDIRRKLNNRRKKN